MWKIEAKIKNNFEIDDFKTRAIKPNLNLILNEKSKLQDHSYKSTDF